MFIPTVIIWAILLVWTHIEIKGQIKVHSSPYAYYPRATKAVTILWVVCLSLWSYYFFTL